MTVKTWILVMAMGGTVLAQEAPPTRDLNAINWIDFQKWVPERVATVLLPVGTLEAHGVANNGADNTVPEALAVDLAERVNAMVAPTIPYGVTTSLSVFPGTFRIAPDVFKSYAREVIRGLAKTGFRNVIVVNGHGPNFDYLQEACAEVSEETGLRTLVFNWWTLTADITQEVYGSDGGHAGVNENAAILATTPEYVHPEYYDRELAWFRLPGMAVYPFPSSIILYQPDDGYPDFDAAKAEQFYEKVVERLQDLILTTLQKWDR